LCNGTSFPKAGVTLRVKGREYASSDETHAHQHSRSSYFAAAIRMDGGRRCGAGRTPISKSLWCDAVIGEGENAPLARRVLKTCKIGGRCHIAGAFSGHGIFFWTQISSVTYLGGGDR
jgi:hypothetical protein